MEVCSAGRTEWSDRLPHEVAVRADELALGDGEQGRSVQPSRGGEVDVLDYRGLFDFGDLLPPCQGSALFLVELPVYQ